MSRDERDAANYAELLMRFIALSDFQSDNVVKLAFDYLKGVETGFDPIEASFIRSAEAFVGQLREART